MEYENRHVEFLEAQLVIGKTVIESMLELIPMEIRLEELQASVV